MTEREILNFKIDLNYQKDSIVSKTITENFNSSLTLFAFDAEQEISTHTVPVDAVVFVVEGMAEVMISEKYYTLTDGEMILMPKNEPHAIKALEKLKMVLFKV